jgi:putative hydrolase of the HAD superfamily
MQPTGATDGIRLVCFDLGGVVVRICRSWAEGCRRAGLPVQEEVAAKNRRTAEWIAANDLYQRGRISRRDFSQTVSAISNGFYSPRDVETLLDHWLYDCYPGVTELIDDLHRANFVTAALSNSSHDHWQQMTAGFDAFNRLRHRFGSHELGMRKPDAEIYRELESRLRVSPSDILFFDDLQENIDGALRCGWNACLIDPAGDTAQQMRAALALNGVSLVNRPAIAESRI